LVSVDSPQKSIWGSRVAGPIFKNIATDLIHYAKLPPQIDP
jgi:cell division protein FtsI/penicillin-binding protein 2